jgi:hypothetical protein
MRTKESVGNEGWILDEDRALRDLLDDITVSDTGKGSRRVGVWFGHPDQEMRQQTYPYITLNLIDISLERDRAERGYGEVPDFWRESLSSSITEDIEFTSDTSIPIVMHQPIPVRLTYQITTWARNPRHDRQILNYLLRYGITPLQAGGLRVSDGTVRRLDTLSFQKRDTVESSKRLLSNAILVGVSSEVPWKTLEQATKVSQVALRFVVSDGAVIPHEDLDYINPSE